MSPRWTQSPTVAVVGGGLAGLAASCALAEAGLRVTLFERRPYLGGRASSYQHPGTGEVVDNCQHVLFGCCTNLVEFYRHIGMESKIGWSDRMTFLEPGGRASVLAPSIWPPPFQTAPAFLRFPFLSLRDKLAIARALAALIPAAPFDNGQSFLAWLRRHQQTEIAIQRFWKPVLVSALSEDLDRMSLSYAAQVVRETLKSKAARRMGIPTIPLSELYDAARDYVIRRGGEVLLRCGVDSFRAEFASAKLSVGGSEREFDFLIPAVSFDVVARMLPETTAAEPLRQMLSQFETSPIAGIHLWFDRQITELEHAVLLDRTIQWMFHKSKLLKRAGGGPSNGNEASAGHGSYVELVVSSSKSLVDKSRSEIVELALSELREFLPEARSANLVKSAVIKEIHATYSPLPGVDRYRPRPETVWPRVFLAGDWTATGWPATMEGAVRSGYAAAECVARVAGITNASFLVPDLAPAGFMRLFG
jgi:squalene-associated FAD-dependent desaturase